MSTAFDWINSDSAGWRDQPQPGNEPAMTQPAPDTETEQTRVEHHLATLGGNPDTIANTLRNAGIKGTWGDVSNCPVACWLTKTLPARNDAERVEVEVDIDIDKILLTWWNTLGITHELRVPPPDAVSAFIDAFDNNCYPDLVDNEDNELEGTAN